MLAGGTVSRLQAGVRVRAVWRASGRPGRGLLVSNGACSRLGLGLPALGTPRVIFEGPAASLAQPTRPILKRATLWTPHPFSMSPALCQAWGQALGAQMTTGSLGAAGCQVRWVLE